VLVRWSPNAREHSVSSDGVERARSKLEPSSLATAFCGPVFTLAELQQVYEAAWGIGLDPRNFYRKIQATRDFVIEVGSARKARAVSISRTRPGQGRFRLIYNSASRHTSSPRPLLSAPAKAKTPNMAT
jgi:hypothetical protein